MSVLVVGSAALDSIETPYGKVDDCLGGSAFFFAATASYFTPVKIVAVVGEDFPMQSIEFLKSRNVDLSGLEVAQGKTFRWGGVYHEDMNQRDTLFTHLNVFETFSPKIPAQVRNTPYVFLANIHPGLQLEVLSQVEDPKLVMLDTMNLWIDTDLTVLKQVLAKVDAVILNDQEARQITGELNVIKAAREVIKLGPETVIIKKGEHGAFIISEDDFFTLPAYPLESLYDPTGAGDSFAGGLIGYLSKVDDLSHQSFRRALVYGTITASFAVEKFSVDRLKDLTMVEIEERRRYLEEITKF
ncbi:sugar kinase [candidate division LCP-89 bacterium B3_LCP]|uniref:Sugar kinase n=1 Tax=candidate division LCP-89 bacterium B3_LCP TaxID=2012998 RepID=A0A532UXZ3_UNCL8|nr:MAG: sugar kinase [candidate division LCP-89 bacterium B3_LCP]